MYLVAFARAAYSLPCRPPGSPLLAPVVRQWTLPGRGKVGGTLPELASTPCTRAVPYRGASWMASMRRTRSSKRSRHVYLWYNQFIAGQARGNGRTVCLPGGPAPPHPWPVHYSTSFKTSPSCARLATRPALISSLPRECHLQNGRQEWRPATLPPRRGPLQMGCL